MFIFVVEHHTIVESMLKFDSLKDNSKYNDNQKDCVNFPLHELQIPFLGMAMEILFFFLLQCCNFFSYFHM